MSKGDNLRSAQKNKEDEFYTQASDIENELKHYKSHFRGQIVFCCGIIQNPKGHQRAT